ILRICSSVWVVASATCKLRFALAVALSRTPSSPWVWGAVLASWVCFCAFPATASAEGAQFNGRPSWLARPVAPLAAAGAAPVSCAVACSDASRQPALSRVARAHATQKDHVERYIQPPCCGRESLSLRVCPTPHHNTLESHETRTIGEPCFEVVIISVDIGPLFRDELHNTNFTRRERVSEQLEVFSTLRQNRVLEELQPRA